MAKQNAALLGFNRGLIDRTALARVDLARMRYSAEEQTNWMPRTFGPMMLRPGLQKISIRTHFNNKAVPIPFVRATNDTAIVEATDTNLRPLVQEDDIIRVTVATAIANGTFAGNIVGWNTGSSQPGTTVAYDAPNQMGLTGTGINDAIAYQQVTVAVGDQGKEHGIRIVITRGPVGLRIGTAFGLDDLQGETLLGVGTHSLAITPPGGVFFIYFFNRLARKVDVGSVAVEPQGVLNLPAPWAESDLPLLRWDQSADVLYVAWGTHRQVKIERRALRSWSIVDFMPEDGPYLPINFSPTSLNPSGLTGDINLQSQSPFFRATHVGALFRLASLGQDIKTTLAGTDQATDPLRVTGVGSSRDFKVIVTGLGTNSLMLQRSTDPDGGFFDVSPITPDGTYTFNDGLDNQIVYQRVVMSAFVSGATSVELRFSGGSISGDVRITEFVDNMHVKATVLSPLGSTDPTTTWYEGAWSDYRGWPTSLALFEDRLWHFGLGSEWSSIVDAYESYDSNFPGDSGPISRTIGKGPVDWVNWGLPLLRLLIGTDGTLASARSDSLDTPLTPTNFNLKFPVTQGAARIGPCAADDMGYFVHRNLLDVYELAFDTSNYVSVDYGAQRTTAICPNACQPGIVKILVQRHPDTRIHAILSDGTVAIFIRDKVEDVAAWIKLETPGAGGKVEDGVVLPSSGTEDAVYYIVNRTIKGVESRYYEKWATEDTCVGGTLNQQADSFIVYHGALRSTLPAVVPHLAGQQVVVWGDGKDLSPGPFPSDPPTYPPTETAQRTYLVADDGTVGPLLDKDGNVVSVRNAIVGLPYEARFKGVKLAYAAQFGSALTMRKTVSEIGFVLADTHSDGLRFGPDYDSLEIMPQVVNGATVPYDQVWEAFDDIGTPFSDKFGTDTRVCLKAYAPRPAKVMGLIVHVDTTED